MSNEERRSKAIYTLHLCLLRGNLLTADLRRLVCEYVHSMPSLSWARQFQFDDIDHHRQRIIQNHIDEQAIRRRERQTLIIGIIILVVLAGALAVPFVVIK